jgi:hypothetical protein
VTIRDGVASVEVPWGPFWKRVPVQLGVADQERVEVRGLSPGTRVHIVN